MVFYHTIFEHPFENRTWYIIYDMKTMFTDEFPDDVQSDEELEKIKAKYPNYEDYYVASGSIKERREKFDEMYQVYAPYADRHFLSDLKKHFHERTWEMYIGYVLAKNGVTFSSTDKGPDFLIETPDGKIWIEAVAPGPGEGPDRVPEMVYGMVSNVPQDKMLMRISSSLDAKYKKFRKYLDDGMVSPEDKLIIALNAGGFSWTVDGDMPLILKALFAVGYRTLSRPINADMDAPLKPGVSTRTFVPKRSNSEVSTTFFLDKEHKIISAVMYSSKNVLNHGDPIGSEISVIRNPLAISPLPETEFPFMDQISTKNGEIRI